MRPARLPSLVYPDVGIFAVTVRLLIESFQECLEPTIAIEITHLGGIQKPLGCRPCVPFFELLGKRNPPCSAGFWRRPDPQNDCFRQSSGNGNVAAWSDSSVERAAMMVARS